MTYKNKSELREILNSELESIKEYERELAGDPKDIYGQAAIAEEYLMAAETAQELGDNRAAFGLFRKSYSHFSNTKKLGIQKYRHRLAKLKSEGRMTNKLKEKASYVISLPPIGPDYNLHSLEKACTDMKKETDRFRRKAALDKITGNMNPLKRGLVKMSRGYWVILAFILTLLFFLPNSSGYVISTNSIKIFSYIGIVFFVLFLFLLYFYIEKNLRLQNLKNNYLKH